jgi:hypothetical protein
MAGAGLAWGLLFAAHYPTAVGAGLPPLVVTAWAIARHRDGARSLVAPFFALVFAAVPLALLGAYHHALHGGAPWVLPASFYEESMIRLRFDPGVLLRGAAYTALHLVRLLGWTFALLPLLAFFAPRPFGFPNRLLWLSIAGLVVLYGFYPSAGGPQYGPRYYFGLLGPLAILAGQAWPRFAATARGRAFLAVLVAGSLVLFGVRTRLEFVRAAEVNAPFRLAAENRLHDAIVFMRNVNRADHSRNPPGWSSSVLFVPDLGERNAEMRALYPERSVFVYRRGPRGPELVPADEDGAVLRH